MVVFDHSKYNILVVDDSKSVNNIIFKTFEKLGYNCFQTFNLKETRELLSTTKMDYIMLDINLPDGRIVRLNEVADVKDTIAERSSIALIDGQRTVGFDAVSRPDRGNRHQSCRRLVDCGHAYHSRRRGKRAGQNARSDGTHRRGDRNLLSRSGVARCLCL